jgi:hypothetical protein
MEPNRSALTSIATIAAIAAVAAVALALSPTAAFAHDPDSAPRLEVHVDGEDGTNFDLSIGAGWIAGLIDSLDVECEVATDADTRRMARHLDRKGEGARFRFVDDDGDDVLAIRRAGMLRIETSEKNGESALVELPWPLAECFLLGREPAGGVGRLLLDSGLKLKVDARDGDGRVRVSID